MAETKKKAVEAEKKAEERVLLRIPRTSEQEEPDAFIFVNGCAYQIPKNTDVMVKPEVKYEYERSEREKAKALTRKQKLSEEAKKF